jgi:anti-sigma regulatory factor (Ser/Thr protein kinase)
VTHQNSILGPATPLSVTDSSSVGEARRAGLAAAEALGFDETRAGNAAIVATEMATNIVRHAGTGELVVKAQERPSPVLELLALDRGPGMRDVERCMEDGYSTAPGGSGTGLGAMRRLADGFDIHSAHGIGTAVLARFHAGVRPPQCLNVGALSIPYPGEVVCGDAWEVLHGPKTCVITVVDGLGHGIDANIAAQEAVRAVEANPLRSVQQKLEFAHAALRHTRGAAMAVAEIDQDSGHVAYAGVGNIVGAIASAQTLHRMVSFDGTVGHAMPQVREFEYTLEPGRLLVMHSDGLKSHWKFDRYPELIERDPLLIAGVLYRDYLRGHDDVTVVVARAVAPCT